MDGKSERKNQITKSLLHQAHQHNEVSTEAESAARTYNSESLVDCFPLCVTSQLLNSESATDLHVV
jgi:hypothetical protein